MTWIVTITVRLSCQIFKGLEVTNLSTNTLNETNGTTKKESTFFRLESLQNKSKTNNSSSGNRHYAKQISIPLQLNCFPITGKFGRQIKH